MWTRGKSYTTDSLYRLMDSVYERLDDLKRIVFEATAVFDGRGRGHDAV
jgi:hypothetical protein